MEDWFGPLPFVYVAALVTVKVTELNCTVGDCRDVYVCGVSCDELELL